MNSTQEKSTPSNNGEFAVSSPRIKFSTGFSMPLDKWLLLSPAEQADIYLREQDKSDLRGREKIIAYTPEGGVVIEDEEGNQFLWQNQDQP